MMAHEVPLQVHQSDSTRLKTRKHKPLHQPKMQLPNGQKPDFGQKETGKEKKQSKKQLPNGEKPDFGGSTVVHAASQNPSGKKTKKSANKKGNSDNKSEPGDIAANKLRGKESYAGSSFHSSPEALALPKPSFAKSSPDQAPSAIPSGPYQSPMQNGQRNVSNMSPAFVYQGMPSNGPPVHPVTLYPPSARPGFEYHSNPQGFINYLYPPAAVPQPPLPMQSYPFQTYPPIPPPVQHHQVGHRITFNELMGSSK